MTEQVRKEMGNGREKFLCVCGHEVVCVMLFKRLGHMGLDHREKCPAAGCHRRCSDQMVLTGNVASLPNAACGASG